jgi:hypothetical protein
MKAEQVQLNDLMAAAGIVLTNANVNKRFNILRHSS